MDDGVPVLSMRFEIARAIDRTIERTIAVNVAEG